MKLLYKIKFDILISAKTLFFIKTSYNVPVRNESISQSKICKKTLFCVVFNKNPWDVYFLGFFPSRTPYLIRIPYFLVVKFFILSQSNLSNLSGFLENAKNTRSSFSERVAYISRL